VIGCQRPSHDPHEENGMARRLKAHDPSKRIMKPVAQVEVRQLAHPRIWATAIKLAGGQRDRLSVDGYTRITVRLP
jgi:hypothetical protein